VQWIEVGIRNLLVLQNAVPSLQSVTAVIRSLNIDYQHAKFVPKTNDMFISNVSFSYLDVDEVEQAGSEMEGDEMQMQQDQDGSCFKGRGNPSLNSSQDWDPRSMVINGLCMKVKAGEKVCAFHVNTGSAHEELFVEDLNVAGITLCYAPGCCGCVRRCTLTW
jgi:hypothetical protein